MVNRTLAQPIASAARAAQTFLARLGRNTAGNVLALVAAALPPILILVGGAVDMGRAYMAQTSLQNACDAGVLAGRRAQAKSGQWTQVEIDKAKKMFDINFQATPANATGTSFVPTNPSVGVISATASTTVPTTIMKIFGTTSFPLSTSCAAEFQISNVDVMMVLDTTGSMACEPNGTNCVSGANSKIEGLKSAVRSFYSTIAAAVPSGSGARVRFAFVPYNGTVNMKNLFTPAVAGGAPDLSRAYLSDTTPYQTKLYLFDQPIRVPTTVDVSNSTFSNDSQCTTWATAASVTSGTRTTSYTKVSWTGGSTKICVRRESTVDTAGPISAYGLNPTTPYRYASAPINTSIFKTFAAVPIATGVTTASTVPAAGYTTGYYDMVTLGSLAGTTNITTTNVTWEGCIEERTTVSQMFTNNTPRTGALDHDLTSAPTTDVSTQWHPFFDQLEYHRGQIATLDTDQQFYSERERQLYNTDRRGNPDPYHLCAPAAKNFAAVDTTAPNTVPAWINTYLATLVADGNTYHDIGMLWGARLANPNGINSAVVNANGLTAISRHIIFLTDGETAPNMDLYSSYGVEAIDNRIANGVDSNTSLANFHNARYTTACQTAKNMGYTIWVIGFGQSVTNEMKDCASGGRYYYATDTSSLQTTFRTIASQVADLRLKS